MKTKKNKKFAISGKNSSFGIIFFIVLVCFLLRFLCGFTLDNIYLPGGADTSTHLLRTWYVATKGMTNWDFTLEAGRTFLFIYPPLGHIITGYLGSLLGYLLAYKLVNDLFYAATVIVFFYFLREFKLDNKKIVVAMIFFSFMPIYSYYFVDGRYPSMASVFFCLLYWIFLKRAVDNNKPTKNLILAGLMLNFSLLMSTTATFMILPIVFVWLLLYKLNIDAVKKFAVIAIIGALLSSWWTMPYYFDRWTTTNGGSASIFFKEPSVSGFQSEMVGRFASLGMMSGAVSTEVILLLIVITGVYCLLSLFTLKNKTPRVFFILTIFIVFISFALNFKRIFIFLPIPLSIIVAEGASMLKNKMWLAAAIIILVVSLASFYSIVPQQFIKPEFPQLPTDGRVLYLGDGITTIDKGNELGNRYEMFFTAANGNEYATGWYTGLNADSESAVFYTQEKIRYGNLITNLTASQDEYLKYLGAGQINYVIVNKRNPEIASYFTAGNGFKIAKENDMIIVFETKTKSSYVSVNGMDVAALVEKDSDKIKINTDCRPGSITVKETYNKNWQAKINTKPAQITEAEYGFMKIGSSETGDCTISMEYVNPVFYMVFTFISFITYAASTFYLAKARE
jgi:hypothetical protein